METTDLFSESIKQDSAITWKDIFSESFVKHSQRDTEYVMQTGTLSRRITEDQMLKTWHRPWLWWVAAKYGVGLIILLYAVFYLCIFFLGAVAESIVHMVMIIPPIIIPAIIMLFLWELNVPQNISIMDLMAYFMAGGILSFLVNSFFFIPFPDGLPAYYAAVREEPAKLIATILILLYIERVKKRKIYGFTGLVVGAAVGAAFSGIESVSYAINYSSNIRDMIDLQLTRSLLALGGHITYCIPYATAIALSCNEHKLSIKSILNSKTIVSFLFSIGLHAIWNGSGSLMIQIGIVIGSVYILLYWVKAAFRDIVLVCSPESKGYEKTKPVSETITICCKTTSLAGLQWQSNGQVLVIGRQKGKCTICYPESVQGVSREHCRILRKDGTWYLQDLHSSYGTYTGKGKLAAYEMYPLKSGENIYLGSKQVWLTVL